MKRTRLLREILLLVTIVLLLYNFLRKPKKHDFNLNTVIETTGEFTDKVNEAFYSYQDSATLRNGDMTLSLVDSFLISLNAEQIYGREDPVAEYIPFFQNIITNISEARDKFSFLNLLRLKKTGSYFSFVMDKSQFHGNLFDSEKKKWKGDVLGEKGIDNFYLFDINTEEVIDSVNVGIVNSTLTLQATTNLKMSVIPALFTKENRPKILVTSDRNEESQRNSQNFTIVDYVTLKQKNKEKISRTNPNLSNQGVYSFFPEDYMITTGRDVSRRIYFSATDLQFFSRHMWINGKEDTYYPLGDALPWAMHFNDFQETNLPANASVQQYITLDYGLQKIISETVSAAPQFRTLRESFPVEANILQQFISKPWQEKRNYDVVRLIHDRIEIIWTGLSLQFREVLFDDIEYLNRNLPEMNDDPIRKNLFVNQILNQSLNNSYSMSFVCADGEGRIRVIYDKKGNSLPIDPNNKSLLSNIRKDLAQNSTYQREKEFWGSLCLLNQAPGSTFKPIVYASLGSQFRNDIWNQLTLNSNTINNQLPLTNFAGVNMNSLENEQNGWNDLSDSRGHSVDPDGYLINSRNIYNGIMLYLGSYSKAKLRIDLYNGTNPILVGITEQTNRPDLFPLMTINNTHYAFSTQNRPGTESGWFNDKNSILASGITEYFDINTVLSTNTASNLLDKNRDSWTGSTNVKTNFALPEMPSFISRDRERINPARTSDYDRIFQGIKQCAQGASPIKLSPLVMTQNYLRIFKASDNINVNLDTAIFRNKSLDNNSIDNAYGGEGNFINEFLRPRIYQPLARVITEGTFRNYQHQVLDLPELNGLHLYAKTATIGNQGGRKNKSLALVISRANLSDPRVSPDSLRNNKMMVCYFTFYNATIEGNEAGGWPEFSLRIMRQILQALVRSNSFGRYFNR